MCEEILRFSCLSFLYCWFFQHLKTEELICFRIAQELCARSRALFKMGLEQSGLWICSSYLSESFYLVSIIEFSFFILF